MLIKDSLLIKTDVTSLVLTDSKVLIGVGGHLHVYNKHLKVIVYTITIFEGQKIYGVKLNSSNTQCLIYGANKLKVYSCNLNDSNIIFKEIATLNCRDWILTSKWLDNDKNIVTVFMHNIVILWTNQLQFVKKVVCQERCILYSAHIVYEEWEKLIILSGTVFCQVLIWWPYTAHEVLCPVLHHLSGHKGVIFSIDYNPKAGLICSTSDDRSARLWSVEGKNLLSELNQTETNIKLKCSLFGHDARVFRCKVLDNYVLTAGEDSLVNVWSLDGILLRKFTAHQNAPIWSIDADERFNQIITGGSNSGVTLFPLQYNIQFKNLLPNNSKIIKKIAILRNKNIVAINEMGILKYYEITKRSWIDLANHDDLKSYALLEVSHCRSFIALAGFFGTIYIYKLIKDELVYHCSHEIVNKSRIYSLHWLSETQFIICTAEGALSLYLLRDNTLELTHSMKLPPSKERWTTAACFCGDTRIAVGDRRGTIYLYSIRSTDPIQIIRKAHNYLGITYLHYKQKKLISLGRDSVRKKYSLDDTHNLSIMSSDKLPFTWLTIIYETDEYYLLLAFSGDDFIIWDCKARRVLLEIPCGGGHRSWDFYIKHGDGYFTFIKDRKIITTNFRLNELHPTEVIDSYHTDEINALLHIKSPNHNQNLLISGGEDTTLRVSKLICENNTINFLVDNVIKSHLSSIRIITKCKIFESPENNRYLLFSGGGRAQIIVWELNTSGEATEITQKYSYYERTDNSESEIRIMSISTVLLDKWVLLIVACSDGALKIFVIDTEDDTLKLYSIGKLFYGPRCILKLSYLHVCDRHIILSMATDGYIAFWDFTTFICNLTNKLDINNIETSLQGLLLNINLFYKIKSHQSGVNSFTYRIVDENTVIFVSGGDDNAITYSLFNITTQDDSLNVKLVFTCQDVSSHCAQISGIFLYDKYVLTASVDQRLNIFNLKCSRNQLSSVHLQKYHLSVSDVQGIECYENLGMIHVIAYGKGIEFCKFEIDAAEKIKKLQMNN